MTAPGWPGMNCRGDAPGSDGGPVIRTEPASRTTRIYRIAELIVRYRPANDGKVWRYRCLETGALSTAEYADEAMATSGARLAAACDIAALFDERPGR